VEEARRGRKQLGMDPPLYDYLLANVREHPVRTSSPFPFHANFAAVPSGSHPMRASLSYPGWLASFFGTSGKRWRL
jgi:hypothetical protein